MTFHRLGNATSSAIISANPSTMLTTPAGSSPSTACGIISCAVTHTMQPAAALSSHGSAAPTCSAKGEGQQCAQRLHQPGRSARQKRPKPCTGAMGQRQAHCCAFRDILQADAKAQRQCTADGIRLPGQCQCSGKALPPCPRADCVRSQPGSCGRCVLPGPACQQLPGKLFHLQKAGPLRPVRAPIADGIHAGSARPRPRSMAGSKKKAPHTGGQHAARCHAAQDALRAGPRPPPQQKHPRCAQCSARRREQQHPRSQDHPVQNNIPPLPVVCAQR